MFHKTITRGTHAGLELTHSLVLGLTDQGLDVDCVGLCTRRWLWLEPLSRLGFECWFGQKIQAEQAGRTGLGRPRVRAGLRVGNFVLARKCHVRVGRTGGLQCLRNLGVQRVGLVRLAHLWLSQAIGRVGLVRLAHLWLSQAIGRVGRVWPPARQRPRRALRDVGRVGLAHGGACQSGDRLLLAQDSGHLCMDVVPFPVVVVLEHHPCKFVAPVLECVQEDFHLLNEQCGPTSSQRLQDREPEVRPLLVTDQIP